MVARIIATRGEAHKIALDINHQEEVRTISQECNIYLSSKYINYSKFAATVFGDPHVYTFDGLEYTFNGKGEYVMVRADSPR